MKPYYQVHMFHLGVRVSALDPNLHGADVKHFNALADAQAFAEAQRYEWHTVIVSKMTKEPGVLEEIERYQEGRNYKIDEIR